MVLSTQSLDIQDPHKEGVILYRIQGSDVIDPLQVIDVIVTGLLVCIVSSLKQHMGKRRVKGVRLCMIVMKAQIL